jgi:hypothetical protein
MTVTPSASVASWEAVQHETNHFLTPGQRLALTSDIPHQTALNLSIRSSTTLRYYAYFA